MRGHKRRAATHEHGKDRLSGKQREWDGKRDKMAANTVNVLTLVLFAHLLVILVQDLTRYLATAKGTITDGAREHNMVGRHPAQPRRQDIFYEDWRCCSDGEGPRVQHHERLAGMHPRSRCTRIGALRGGRFELMRRKLCSMLRRY